jgi:hypothetical protein
MLGILWTQTVSLGAGVPVLDVAAFIAGIVIVFGSIAAALLSPGD